jgi:NADP-dependent 3-hydroxy acid dehydrogenase YdfG
MKDKKVIWITGASTGIGKATALKFASKGWSVAISARRNNLLDELCHLDSNIYSFPLDVTNEDDCKKTFDKIIEKFGNIDLCIFATGLHDPESEKVFNSKIIRKLWR